MSAPQRTFVPEDLYRLVQVGDPQMHPDGDAVAFVRSHVAGEKKELHSHIWIAPLQREPEGLRIGQARSYTRGPRRDGQPRWSPDGRRLAFVRQTGDGPDADRQIWIIEKDGGEAWPLTSMRHGAANPTWSPDGRRIAFTAALGDDESDAQAASAKTEGDRKKDKQRARDEGRLIDRFQYKFDSTGIFPPRKTHVWVVDVPTLPPPPMSEAASKDAVDSGTDGGNGTENGADDKNGAENGLPVPRRVTAEPFNHSLLDWSPDGRFVAVSASYEDERLPVNDIWIFPVPVHDAPAEGSGPKGAVKLTDSDGVFYDARWSPDGKRLAVVGHLREHRSATMSRLWIFPAPGNGRGGTCITKQWDRGLGGTVNSDFRPGMAGVGLTWGTVDDDAGGTGSAAVYFVADDRGRTKVYRVPVPENLDAAGDKAEPETVIGGPAEVYGFSLSLDGRLAAVAAADMFNPGDIYVFRSGAEAEVEAGAREPVAAGGTSPAGAGSEKSGDDWKRPVPDRSGPGFESKAGWRGERVTAVNGELLSRIEFPSVEEIVFEAEDGLPIHGWIMRPVPSAAPRPGNGDAVPTSRGKAPAVLQIHGGPHTCWGHSFSLEMHLQAAMGYAVLFVNPRGSTGYGQRFATGVLDDYGGMDYKDLMAAVDYAIGLGGIDEERLAVTGGSYGGFMTNWIVTQTNRFRAGISHRSISNWISFWGVSDIGPRFMDGEFGAPSLWDGFDDMWERSPLKHARNVETPLLLCHSEHDLRCPMEQAEQFYLALKWEGKVAELLRHPRSNHDLTRTGPPTLRVDRFGHIARFLNEHVAAAPATK